jgi:hypothetical protein
LELLADRLEQGHLVPLGKVAPSTKPQSAKARRGTGKKKRGRRLKEERFETANPCMKEKEKRQLFVGVVDGALRELCLLFICMST